MTTRSGWAGCGRPGCRCAGRQRRSTRRRQGLRHLLDEATPAASTGLRELVANSVADGTRAAYEKDWLDFDVFCRAHGYGDPLDATALVVGEYVNDLVRDRKAYSTITRRLAAIGFCQRLATGRHGHP